MNGWRGRWVDFYAKRNPDPHHWYNLLQNKLGITTLPEDPRINNNAPLPPKKKAKLSTTSTKTATPGTAQPMPAAMGKRNVRDAAHPKPKPASGEFSAEDDKLLETLGIALALLPPAAHGGLWEEFQDKVRTLWT